MSDLMVDINCERCGDSFQITPENYEKAMTDEQPFLCNTCYDILLEKQEKENQSPQRQFEYKTDKIAGIDFESLGKDGWELVGVDSGTAYFKKECFK